MESPIPKTWSVFVNPEPVEPLDSEHEVVRDFVLVENTEDEVAKKFDPKTRRPIKKPDPMVKRGPGVPQPAPDLNASPQVDEGPTVDERLDGIDERLDGIDERLDGIDERLKGVEEGLRKILDHLSASDG